MFVAVIRGDLSGPISLLDLEPKSQTSPAVETCGQNRYLSRPDAVKIQSYFTAQGLSASPSALITATVPVGGPINLAGTTILGVAGLGAITATQLTAIQALLAAKLVETDIVKQSFLAGNLQGFLLSTFNPDTRRTPALSNGPAIAVVQDDGVSVFTVSVPVLTTAATNTPSAGALRITGSGFLGTGLYEPTVVLQGTAGKKLTQQAILAAGGTVTDSQIDIPASLVVGVLAGFTSARVKVTNRLSNLVALS